MTTGPSTSRPTRSRLPLVGGALDERNVGTGGEKLVGTADRLLERAVAGPASVGASDQPELGSPLIRASLSWVVVFGGSGSTTAFSKLIPVDDLYVVDSFDVIDVRGKDGEPLGTSGRADIDVVQVV